MPIKVQSDLPVRAILEQENIFVMDENRALSQNIRPLKIGILNLMPLKEDTELQILRSLSNTPRSWILPLLQSAAMSPRIRRRAISISSMSPSAR